MNSKKLSESQYQKIYSSVPRLCIDIVIVQNKKILLTKRSIPPFKGMWHLPGGGLRYREKISKAISRIAKDELGVKVIPQKLAGYVEIKEDGYKHSVSLAIVCKPAKNSEPKPLEQASEVRFFSKVPSQRIMSGHKNFLKENWNTIVK
jgi:ADP-ribose pyrophosphatase YjhB (NUDIX family)